MKREYQTTEFWAIVIGAIAWLIDINTGTDLLSNIDLASITDAKAQVIAIAANLKQATGSDSNLIVYAAGIIYILRKSEKIASIWKGK